jgi:hypothetical protein
MKVEGETVEPAGEDGFLEQPKIQQLVIFDSAGCHCCA